MDFPRLKANPVLQHEHGFVSNGYAGSLALGESFNDASIRHFSHDYRAAGGEGCEHPLRAMEVCWAMPIGSVC